MKVLYPVPEILPDSRARFIQMMNTCNALAQLGNEVVLIAGIKKGWQRGDILRFYGLPEQQNLKIVGLPIMRREQAALFRFSWHGVFHVSLLIYLLSTMSHRDNHTVFFVRHMKLANFLLKFRALFKAPLVFEVHEIFHITGGSGMGRARTRSLEQKVYGRVDALITISQTLKEYLVSEGIPSDSIHVIHNGIETEWFLREHASPGSYICYTGSLYIWKGVDVLIAAMKHMPNETLVIIGGGRRLEELKALAGKEGVADRINFAGPVSRTRVPEYLSHAKVAVLPNIPSGPSQFSSPLKLFEYMACGVPVVAADVPAFREILRDGRNAVLCEPGNPAALAEGMRRVIDSGEFARRLALTAKEDAKNYTYQKRAEKISRVIGQLRP